jgi:hypothetical protein
VQITPSTERLINESERIALGLFPAPFSGNTCVDKGLTKLKKRSRSLVVAKLTLNFLQRWKGIRAARGEYSYASGTRKCGGRGRSLEDSPGHWFCFSAAEKLFDSF